MTNTEAYNAVMEYKNLRAKSGCTKNKKYWISELRILRHLVDHEIIMNRGNNGNSNECPELQKAYDKLKSSLTQAMEFVHENTKKIIKYNVILMVVK